MRRRRSTGIWIALLSVALVASACSDDADGQADDSSSTTAPTSSGGPTTTPDDPDDPAVTVEDRIRVEVLSSQPDRVTGDEARVRITPMSGGDPAALVVTVDGRDVTEAFAPIDDGAIEGLVTGLVEGTNSLTATDGAEATTLRLRAWPRQGPMISGWQTPLPACATEDLGLGTAEPATCAAPARTTWRAITAGDRVVELTDPTAPPPDGTISVEVDDDPLPALVRVEQGVINRSTYELAVLDREPGRPDRDLRPAWNGRLVVRFADGCGAGHGQGVPGVTAVEPALLREGYAVVTASFTTGAVQCNDVIASETVMMLRERVVELLGEIDHTIGEGTGFGGAAAHLILQNYPDLLDGVATVDAYADAASTANQVADCLLLEEYHRSRAGAELTERQRAAIAGHSTSRTCRVVERDLGAMFDPTACDPAIPAEDVYDPTTNPAGLRCTYQDLNVIPFGTDELTGDANRPVDNVGVQYGLDALNRGTITVDEFLDLNEHIGGLDADGTRQRARSEIDPMALLTMYENGRVAEGAGDLRRVPIIDVVHADDGRGDPGDLHQALALRTRLLRGAHAEAAPGHQIWVVPRPTDGTGGGADTAAGDHAIEAVLVIDRWLTAMADSDVDRSDALRSERPDDAFGRCDAATADAAVDVFDLTDGECLDPDRPAGDPRMAAGAPPTGDIIKCQLKAIDELDYEVSFTAAQLDRLVGIFPTGVCDWYSVGSGQTLPTMPDRSFEDVEVPADLA